MTEVKPLLIFGASTRAAAFSALRAGMQPWCADLFADADLGARCPVTRVPPDAYPRAFAHLVQTESPGPWMYTGALENWPWQVQQMSRERTLWGNGWPSLRRARAPSVVASILARARLACPAVRLASEQPPIVGRWLVKPFSSAGGQGIRFWDGKPMPPPPRPPIYLQQYVAGLPYAALYLGNGRQSLLLGVTRQLVGAGWLHAKFFQYCGSIGPVPLEQELRRRLQNLGTVLAQGCRLRGLFGVDYVLQDGAPWPVEINPRYTASVEVLEHATGLTALALHARVFESASRLLPPMPEPSPAQFVGKAILFAREALTFPPDGPWVDVLRYPSSIHEVPTFADIPDPGERIEAGRPILTFFARAESEVACQSALQQIAEDLDRWLFGT
jgi:predicted ATP-grasp superfamily ATP-dependent carboligase